MQLHLAWCVRGFATAAPLPATAMPPPGALNTYLFKCKHKQKNTVVFAHMMRMAMNMEWRCFFPMALLEVA